MTGAFITKTTEWSSVEPLVTSFEKPCWTKCDIKTQKNDTHTHTQNSFNVLKPLVIMFNMLKPLETGKTYCIDPSHLHSNFSQPRTWSWHNRVFWIQDATTKDTEFVIHELTHCIPCSGVTLLQGAKENYVYIISFSQPLLCPQVASPTCSEHGFPLSRP